jgi:hypothetical protein
LRIVGGLYGQDHERPAPVASAGGTRAPDFGKEAAMFGLLPRRHAFGRQHAVAPDAAEQHPFFGCVDDEAFVVGRRLAEGGVLEDVQVVQDLAHVHRVGAGPGRGR